MFLFSYFHRVGLKLSPQPSSPINNKSPEDTFTPSRQVKSEEKLWSSSFLESFRKFKSEVKERMKLPSTIHCNYILHNPVISNHIGHTYGLPERNTPHMYHHPFDAYQFPNQSFPSGLNFNLNNAHINPTTVQSKKTNPVESPCKEEDDIPQFGYKTPSCAPTKKQDLRNLDSRRWTQEEGVSDDGISPYTQKEMGCLELFKQFMQTPMKAESMKPSVKNKIILTTPPEGKCTAADVMEIETEKPRKMKERLVICSEKMFENQSFVESLEELLETEILSVNFNNDIDGIFYLNNDSCVLLFRDCEDGKDYEKANSNVVKMLIKESLKNSNILILFLLDSGVL